MASAFYDKEDVKRILECADSYAYKVIRELRDEMADKGYILPPAGKMYKAYFDERLYGCPKEQLA